MRGLLEAIRKSLVRKGAEEGEGGEEVEVEKEIEILPPAGEVSSKPTLRVRVKNVMNVAEVDLAANYVKRGDVVIVKIKDLQRRDIGQFQNVLQKIKKVSMQFGFHVAAVKEGYLIVTPPNVEIEG